MITYHNGDILDSGASIITHQVNCQGVMGAGLAKQIRDRYPSVYTRYHDFCCKFIENDSLATDDLLGFSYFTSINNDVDLPFIVNCFAQDGYGKDAVQTDYEALKECLNNTKLICQASYDDLMKLYNLLLTSGNRKSGQEGQQAGLDPTTIKFVHNVLTKSLKEAVLSDLIAKNPCDGVKLPKCKKYKSVVLNNEQISKLLDTAKGTDIFLPMKSANGGVTAYAYDLEGNVTSITNALGRKESFQYDLAGRLMMHAQKSGRKITYRYDTLDNLVEVGEKGQNSLARYGYDADGYPVQSENAEGSLKYSRDLAGRPTRIQQPDGSVITYEYDDAGRVTSLGYPDGTRMTYAYDKNDRILSAQSSTGTKTEYTYDKDGRPLEERTGTLRTTYTYDTNGRLEKKEARQGLRTIASFAYTYDAGGNITKEEVQQDGDSWVKTYAYDELDRLVGCTAIGTFDGASIADSITYEYDKNGNRTAETVNGVRAEYVYNAANQLVKVGNETYTYDKNGNRTRTQNGGRIVVNLYNQLNQLIGVYASSNDGIYRTYGYDAEGNRLYERRYYREQDWELKTEYELEVVKTESRWSKTVKLSDGEYQEQMEEDEFFETPLTPVNVGIEYWEETCDVEEEQEPIVKPAKEPSFFWYGFGQSLSRSMSLPPLSELLSKLWNELWVFGGSVIIPDPVERQETQVVPVENEPVPAPEESPAQPEEETEWLPEEFETKSGVTTKETLVETEKQEWVPVTKPQYDLIWYINDVNREHTEVLMTRSARDGSYTRRYTYGNERLTWDYGMWGNNQGYVGVSGQYVTDGRGSAAMLLDRQSLDTQFSHYYDPYGEVTSVDNLTGNVPSKLYFGGYMETGPQAGQWDAYRYNSEDYDDGLSMQYLRARYLDNSIASFLSEDTYLGNKIEPLSLNLYVYVQGNPNRWIDPSGHATKCGNVQWNMYMEIIKNFQQHRNNFELGIAAALIEYGIVTPAALLGRNWFGFFGVDIIDEYQKLVAGQVTIDYAYYFGRSMVDLGLMISEYYATAQTVIAILGSVEGIIASATITIGTGGTASVYAVPAIAIEISAIVVSAAAVGVGAKFVERSFNHYKENTNKAIDDYKKSVDSGSGNGGAGNKWGNPDTLQKHFNDHGADFGSANPNDYANQANNFYNNSGNYQVKVDADGVIRVYDSATNSFGAYNADGTTRTFFKPTGGQGYFDRQPGVIK